MTRIAATAIVLLVMLGAGARADDKPQNTLPPRAITHHTIGPQRSSASITMRSPNRLT